MNSREFIRELGQFDMGIEDSNLKQYAIHVLRVADHFKVTDIDLFVPNPNNKSLDPVLRCKENDIFVFTLIAMAKLEFALPLEMISDDERPSVYYAHHLQHEMSLPLDTSDTSMVRRILYKLGYVQFSYKNPNRFILKRLYNKKFTLFEGYRSYSYQYQATTSGFWFVDYNYIPAVQNELLVSIYPETILPPIQ